MTQEEAENMSNEQAVRVLTPLRDAMRDRNGCPTSDAYFALDMAIKALESRKTGRWRIGETHVTCSECGDSFMMFPPNYCPNCGVRMRGAEE